MPRVRGEGCQPDDPRTICGGQSRAGISQNPGSPVQLRRAAPAARMRGAHIFLFPGGPTPYLPGRSGRNPREQELQT